MSHGLWTALPGVRVFRYDFGAAWACGLLWRSMTACAVYPKGRKSARKTLSFHAPGISVEWKKQNDKLKVVREKSYGV